MGYLPSETRQRLDALLDALGLPFACLLVVLPDGIQEGIKVDKKRTGSIVNFVLLKDLGLPFIRGHVDEKMIAQVLMEMMP